MRYQAANPIWNDPEWRKLLTKSGRYPAQHVDIFWNNEATPEGYRVLDVEVVFVPRQALRDRDLQRAYGAYNKQWRSDLGNSVAGWMSSGPDRMTPETVFGDLLRNQFKNQDELINALKEFSHIEECEWARDMYSSFNIDDDEDDEYDD